MKIGITERGDAGLDHEWISKQKDVDGLILISKSPHLIPIDRITKPFIIHCTITGYGKTHLEPKVEYSKDTLNVYRSLVDKFGPDKIVLRVDPIILEFPELPKGIIEQSMGRTRISFLDKYKHSINRIKKFFPDFEDEPFHYPLDKRLEFVEKFCSNAEICGEPDMKCSGCISAKDLQVMNLNADNLLKGNQRKACACLAIKTELLSRKTPCAHGCLYCYWK